MRQQQRRQVPSQQPNTRAERKVAANTGNAEERWWLRSRLLVCGRRVSHVASGVRALRAAALPLRCAP